MKINYVIIILVIIVLFAGTVKSFNFFSKNKKTIWIYNPILKNSNKWKGVYSRRSVQDTIGLVKLCINSAQFNLGKDYNIKLFNQDDLDTLIPESMDLLDLCKTRKVKDICIKYSILYKYGGVWLPNSTIILNPFIIIKII